MAQPAGHEFIGAPLPAEPPPPVPAPPPAVATPSVAIPESKAGQGMGTTPVPSRDMRRMPSDRPGAAESAPPPLVTPEGATVATTQPYVATGAGPDYSPDAFPFTLSREDDHYPRAMDTLDELCVHLKHVRKYRCCDQPLAVDIEVKVDHLVKRYRELRQGARITGRGHSHHPYAITVTAIDSKTETASFVIEPIKHLPLH